VYGLDLELVLGGSEEYIRRMRMEVVKKMQMELDMLVKE